MTLNIGVCTFICLRVYAREREMESIQKVRVRACVRERKRVRSEIGKGPSSVSV